MLLPVGPQHLRACFLLLISAVGMLGCSTGAAPTSSLTISQDEAKAGTINVAKVYLDTIEKMPPQQRQLMVTKDAHVSGALKKAVAIDPATKTRMESLGLSLP